MSGQSGRCRRAPASRPSERWSSKLRKRRVMTGEIRRPKPARDLPARHGTEASLDAKDSFRRRGPAGPGRAGQLGVHQIPAHPLRRLRCLRRPRPHPVGALDGTWAVSAGSVAGFRVPETAFGMSNDAVGRTTAVSGAVVISGDRVTSATFRIDLAALNGERQDPAAVRPEPRHRRGSPTRRSPWPSRWNWAPRSPRARPSGSQPRAWPTMNGVTHLVTATVSARRDGSGA